MSASLSSTAPSFGIDASDANTRALAVCVVLSVLLHAAVLFLLPSMREGKPAAAPLKMLTARIASRAAAPEPPPSARVEPAPPPRVEPPRPVITTPKPSPAAPRVAPPPPVPAPQPPPPTPPAATASPAAPATPTAPTLAEPRTVEGAPDRPGRVGPPEKPPPVQVEGIDPGTLDRFRLEILAATRRYKRYPAQAMEKGWQGRVEIRIAIGANGMTQSMVIRSSSGFELLDDTALDMVKKGRPLVQVPASLRGREFIVDVPVIFDLKSG